VIPQLLTVSKADRALCIIVFDFVPAPVRPQLKGEAAGNCSQRVDWSWVGSVPVDMGGV